MSIEPQFQGSAPARSWVFYLMILGLIVGVIVALNLSGIRHKSTEASSAAIDYIIQGDINVRFAVSNINPRDTRFYLQKAIEYYNDEIPSPAAYRRIGVAQQELFDKSGIRYFDKLDSSKAIKGLSKREATELTAEVRMWRDIYGERTISRSTASKYISRINKLDLGPLKQLAIMRVYYDAGENAKAKAVYSEFVRNSKAWAYKIITLFMCLLLAGIVGFVLLIRFLTRNSGALLRAEQPKIQSSVLFISFLAYLISYFLLSILLQVLLLLAGIDIESNSATIVYLAAQIVAMFGAYGLGLACLRTLTTYSQENPCEISPVKLSILESIRWGVGGYCAALPLLVAGVAVSNVLFKGYRTPANPIVDVASQGGLEFAITLIMAAVIAPIVEETAFRGMLYTGLRTKMGVWGAAILSGAIFSIIHPTLPGGFLPILALGVVFSLLREKTGSLVPGMIAHGINNTIMFLLVYLLYW